MKLCLSAELALALCAIYTIRRTSAQVTMADTDGGYKLEAGTNGTDCPSRFELSGSSNGVLNATEIKVSGFRCTAGSITLRDANADPLHPQSSLGGKVILGSWDALQCEKLNMTWATDVIFMRPEQTHSRELTPGNVHSFEGGKLYMEVRSSNASCVYMYAVTSFERTRNRSLWFIIAIPIVAIVAVLVCIGMSCYRRWKQAKQPQTHWAYNYAEHPPRASLPDPPTQLQMQSS